MGRIWELKKRSLSDILVRVAAASAVLRIHNTWDRGDEWRAVVEFLLSTLARAPDGSIGRTGPVLIGIRYQERFLREVPHSMELATVINPLNIFHPNCGMGGCLCLGHPGVAPSLETMLHQIWCGLNLNMRYVNTGHRGFANPEAAAYVRAHAAEFPLNPRGLYESPAAPAAPAAPIAIT